MGERADWEDARLGDILAPNLRVVFVGLNPGRHSAGQGHHFAGPGNHFWRLLYDAGFSERLLAANEDRDLLTRGLGLTNIVARPSRGEADLGHDELVDGGRILREKLRPLRPKVVALLGKQVYRGYAGLRASARVEWGWQTGAGLPGVRAFAAPNPSPRSTLPYAERLRLFSDLRAGCDVGDEAP